MANDIVGAGLRGILTGLTQAAQAAEDISTSFQPESTTDYTDAAISLIGAENQVKASRKVVEIGAELDKEVLSILA